MKAAYFMQHGGPEVLVTGELPEPAAGPGEVLVEVHAASVNGADWKVRAGRSGTVGHFPYVPGRDFSGVVAACGAGVSEFRPGDAVFGVCDVGQEGTYAEKVAVKAEFVAKKPAGLSHVDGAALALAGLTAINSVDDTLKLKRGETILIQGGAGGVAGFAVQLAKHIGAKVIATASANNLDYVRELGADQVIDYNKHDFTSIGPICDVVFDTVGGSVRAGCYNVLRPGGRLVWIAPAPEAPPRSDVATLKPDVKRDRAHLERMLALLAAGAVQPPALHHYKLADAAEAHKVSEGRHLRGKLILDVR
jgi:NADPH:quinone reductase-like Zn-dependent oxidoreductase